MSKRIIVGFILLIAVALVATQVVGPIIAKRRAAKAISAMLGGAPPPAGSPAGGLEKLPAIVRTYLSAALPKGLAAKQMVHLEQRGRVRLRPGGEWLTFKADQYFCCRGLRFVISARMNMGPMAEVSLLDTLSRGKGGFSLRLWGLIPMSQGKGRQVTVSNCVRALAESVWFPWALDPRLGPVRWSPGPDPLSAFARLEVSMPGGETLAVKGLFKFSRQGLPISFTSQDRFWLHSGSGHKRTPWQITYQGHAKVGGLLMPMAATVAWLPREGRFPYLEFTVTGIFFK